MKKCADLRTRKNNYTITIKGNVKLWKWPAPQKQRRGKKMSKMKYRNKIRNRKRVLQMP